jgi:hypothetical protein
MMQFTDATKEGERESDEVISLMAREFPSLFVEMHKRSQNAFHAREAFPTSKRIFLSTSIH